MYAVEFLPSAARELSKLEPAVRRRLARRIDRFAQDPRGGAVKLRGAEDVWRVRVGDYRIVYQVHDDRLLILVIRIGHRRDVYR
jgi:mRNA interferase RelE/StbE